MSDQSIPLCVDLDGSLVKQDLFTNAYIDLLKKNFFMGLMLLWLWPVKGRAAFKAQVAAKVAIDLTTVVFNQELIQFLVSEQGQGRKIILVTANDSRIAHQVADHLGFFTEVIASDGIVNLKGRKKAKKLVDRYSVNGFDYVGNDDCDIPVWQQARRVYVVTKTERLLDKVRSQKKIDRVFNW
ncbi:MAG: hypothetical protein V4501_08505 [Pseudomonadota bacterium]